MLITYIIQKRENMEEKKKRGPDLLPASTKASSKGKNAVSTLGAANAGGNVHLPLRDLGPRLAGRPIEQLGKASLVMRNPPRKSKRNRFIRTEPSSFKSSVSDNIRAFSQCSKFIVLFISS